MCVVRAFARRWLVPLPVSILGTREAATIAAMAGNEVFTIGHSTHPIERFVELLQRHEIEVLADVRRFPGSRRNPQFNVGPLRESLAAMGIAFEPMGDELGGRRKPSKVAQGPAAVWRNDAFRGYAEYMETPEFAAGLERLEGLARERRTAVMCAEALWWRCHRRLIADALSRRGWRVVHIGSDGRTDEHQATLS
jgi:uncharacterized protein (DUF488 family)